MFKSTRLLTLFAFATAYLNSGCVSNIGYEIYVLGNAYNLAGQPISGLTGEFCGTIHLLDEPDVTECAPVSTNGEGQFSTTLNATSTVTYDSTISEVIGYDTYLEVNGVKYSGKVIQWVEPGRADHRISEGSLVINYTINQ